jgi:20S proteasome subunit alpha 7
VKAVENGGTIVGIRCKDGVVLAAEKLLTSKLLKPGANDRIYTVDRNIGVVCGNPIPSLSSSFPLTNTLSFLPCFTP